MTPRRMAEHRIAGPRLIAIVGPFQTGKTSLLEGLLARGGGVARQGAVREGTTVGDSCPEARAHQMSVEPNIAHVDYMGDRVTFFDCPGSVEFFDATRAALPVCDAAVVVCEADPRKVQPLRVILRELEEMKIPRLLFLNKVDLAGGGVREALEMLQPASRTPLLLRQIPLWEKGVATGFVDLALERAFVYREAAPSEVVDMPDAVGADEKRARYSMLERLADYDDELMEQLLNDIEPPRDKVFDDLARDLREGHVVPLLMGSATARPRRHPAPEGAAPRGARHRARPARGSACLPRGRRSPRSSAPSTPPTAASSAWRGCCAAAFTDGATVTGSSGDEARIAGLQRLMGSMSTKIARAEEGDTAAFQRLEGIATGESISEGKAAPAPARAHSAQPPTQSVSIRVKDRKDETRLSAALAKMTEEDGALTFEHDAECGELKLHGQGEMHLRVTAERLAARFGVEVETGRPTVAYRETIRESVQARGRLKKQSGGHGQFGDVLVEVAPRARGEGFAFAEKIHGGTVPRNYFPSVEIGSKEALQRGPLGFPVVDIAVTLLDGSYHTVNSSDMAFRAAAKIALGEALPKARPVLLEPVQAVDIHVPSEAIARATALVASRRGQILGFEPRSGWDGWETAKALIPEAEIGDLIVELRSATAGVGAFEAHFDHLAELSGKPAEAVIAARRKAG